MRDNPPSPDLGLPKHLHNPPERMKSPPCLERPNLLLILAFEQHPDLRLRGLFPFPGCPFQGIFRLGRGCESGDCGVGADGRVVDIGTDAFVGVLDGEAG